MKDCIVCQKTFAPMRIGQAVCGFTCAKRVPILQRKADKEKLKRRADYLKDTERAFNAYICCRDKNLPCVSCGCVESPGWHASHYRSVGSSPALRFDPANVHRSCVKCNLHLHGNPIPYRIELLRRIGPAELDRLEGPQASQKYTIEALNAIKDNCRRMTRLLESERDKER